MKLPNTRRVISTLALIAALIFAGSPASCSLDTPGVPPDYYGGCPAGYRRENLGYNGAPWCFKATQVEPAAVPVHYASGLTDYTVTVIVTLDEADLNDLFQFYCVDGELNPAAASLAAEAAIAIFRQVSFKRPRPPELACVNWTSR